AALRRTVCAGAPRWQRAAHEALAGTRRGAAAPGRRSERPARRAAPAGAGSRTTATCRRRGTATRSARWCAPPPRWHFSTGVSPRCPAEVEPTTNRELGNPIHVVGQRAVGRVQEVTGPVGGKPAKGRLPGGTRDEQGRPLLGLLDDDALWQVAVDVLRRRLSP